MAVSGAVGASSDRQARHAGRQHRMRYRRGRLPHGRPCPAPAGAAMVAALQDLGSDPGLAARPGRGAASEVMPPALMASSTSKDVLHRARATPTAPPAPRPPSRGCIHLAHAGAAAERGCLLPSGHPLGPHTTALPLRARLAHDALRNNWQAELLRTSDVGHVATWALPAAANLDLGN